MTTRPKLVADVDQRAAAERGDAALGHDDPRDRRVRRDVARVAIRKSAGGAGCEKGHHAVRGVASDRRRTTLLAARTGR